MEGVDKENPTFHVAFMVWRGRTVGQGEKSFKTGGDSTPLKTLS
jgi:hypothetical protein